jgi:GTP-sensing pleiotropic transcriptional regulator CodY
MKVESELTRIIREVVDSATEPLETTEVHIKVGSAAANLIKGGITRDVLVNRLFTLSTMGMIRGKKVGAAKGTWIWWGRSVRGPPEIEQF